MFLYSIYDKKAKKFDNVMVFPSDEVAKRSLVASLNNQSLLVLYPSDYQLVLLGDFNDHTGAIGTDDVRNFDIIEMIPEKLKQYCLDGSFK